MTQFNIAEAKTNFSTLVKKAMLGEEVIIAKDNHPLLKLTPIKAAPEGARKLGSAKHKLLAMAADFDKTPEDFEEYI